MHKGEIMQDCWSLNTTILEQQTEIQKRKNLRACQRDDQHAACGRCVLCELQKFW